MGDIALAADLIPLGRRQPRHPAPTRRRPPSAYRFIRYVWPAARLRQITSRKGAFQRGGGKQVFSSFTDEKDRLRVRPELLFRKVARRRTTGASWRGARPQSRPPAKSAIAKPACQCHASKLRRQNHCKKRYRCRPNRFGWLGSHLAIEQAFKTNPGDQIEVGMAIRSTGSRATVAHTARKPVIAAVRCTTDMHEMGNVRLEQLCAGRRRGAVIDPLSLIRSRLCRGGLTCPRPERPHTLASKRSLISIRPILTNRVCVGLGSRPTMRKTG